MEDYNMRIYDFTVEKNDREKTTLKAYEGKVLLIVNTATECGFTPQYAELQQLYQKYQAQGFEILDFPCDQFGHQAPGTDEEIAQFCSGRFGVTFPQFHKIDVNGKNEIPLYAYLKAEQVFHGFDEGHPLTPQLDEMLKKENPDYANEPDIKWNFTKFLVDRAGNVVRRFEPTADFSEIGKEIEKYLN